MTGLLEGHLVVGAMLFVLGAIGFLTRRNLILMMLSVELMLHGVSINLTAFGWHHGHHSGQVFTIFVLTIAACEAGLALALILGMYQRRKSLDVQLWSNLGEPDLPRLAPEPTPPPAEEPVELPHLAPAGRVPRLPPRRGVGKA
jgi:NADH-quinone oxidoreductase subunit K